MADDATSSKSVATSPNHDINMINPVTTDLISHLPDDILRRIISLLPFGYAVRTGLLSTRWKHVWKSALVLILVDGVTNTDDRSKLLNELTNKWGFQFDFRCALSYKGTTLRLDFASASGDNQLGETLQEDFDWLIKLPMCTPMETSYSWRNWMTEIKSLKISSINCLAEATLCSVMLRNMPPLKKLTIARCNGLSYLEIRNMRIGFEKLAILDCPQLECIRFPVSNIKLSSFAYRGRLILESPQLDSVHVVDDGGFEHCNLEDVMLYIKQEDHCINHHPFIFGGGGLFIRRLRSLQWRVTSLTLCRWVFEALMMCNEDGICLNDLEELWWIDCSAEEQNINSLLFFSHFCPDLKRLYITIDPESCGEASTIGNPTGMSSRMKSLELVKLEGFANENEEIMLVKKLRHIFKLWPLIVANTKGTPSGRVIESSLDLVEVNDVHQIYPIHIHMKL